jgi:hypothetical protein
MSAAYFMSIGKPALLRNPQDYPWNCVLYYVQFTQEELLGVKEHLDIVALVKFQTAATCTFLRTHFEREIDESLEVDWVMVEKHCPS